MPLSLAPPISWKTEHGDQGATDDIVAVSAINRATASRMKSVSRMKVWEDAQTRLTLLERQYLHEAKLLTTLALTMTDLDLARRYDAEQEEQVRRKWRKVPIPMPEPMPPRK